MSSWLNCIRFRKVRFESNINCIQNYFNVATYNAKISIYVKIRHFPLDMNIFNSFRTAAWGIALMAELILNAMLTQHEIIYV